MASIFRDSKGLLLIDYLPHHSSITGEYYAGLLRKLREAIKEKRRGKLSRGVLLLHDNAPVHKSRVAQAQIQQCGSEELAHPAYSPDLAPSDFHLFRVLKAHLRGQRFQDDEHIKGNVEQWFDTQPETFFSSGIVALEQRWTKCIQVLGNYIEK